MRTVTYVDGFNLYYSVLRRTNLKWLDLVALFRDHVLDSNAQLLEVRYYTAPILARMSDDHNQSSDSESIFRPCAGCIPIS